MTWAAHISHAIEFNGCVRCGTVEREFAITLACPYRAPGDLHRPASGASEAAPISASQSTGALPTDATARLIAAAPTMYRELEQAADTFRDFSNVLNAIGKDVMAAAASIAERHIRESLAAIGGAS